MRIRKSFWRAAAVLLCAGMLIPFASRKENAAQAEKKVPRIIVALGDSYASGEGNEPFFGQEITNIRERQKNTQAWEDWLAHRSELAWSGQLYVDDDEKNMCVRVIRDETWFFAAASGAETENIVRTPYNKKPNKQIDKGELEKKYDRDGVSGTYYLPGQLNIFYDNGGAFDRNDVDFVTISIGGNDVGFTDILKLAALNGLFSSELYDDIDYKLEHFYDPGSTHDDILETYLRIHKAAPNATIIVTGYPKLLSYLSNVTVVGHMGCPLFNVLECKYIDDAVTQFNERIEAIVSECRTLYDVDIEFCPIEETFDGHEAYSILKTPYIRRIEFGKNDQDIKESIDVAEKDFISFYSMHPNELGQKAYADCVNETIRSVEEKRHGSEQVLDPWLQYYYRFIMDREYLSLSPGRFSDEAPHLFGLHDMDGNGIPELLVYNGKLTRDADGCIVYTYRGSIEEVDGLVFCEWMNDGDVGLSYIDNYWYPGLFSSEASTGLIYTEYFTVDAQGAIKSENVEIYDWSDGTTVSRTSDDSLYSLYKGGNLKPLPMYTYEEIMNMDWSAFAAEEPGQYEDLWTAIDRSGVRRYLLMTYEEIRGEAGELEWVYMMPDEFLFYNYCFKEMPGYAFDFDADFVDAVGATDCFEIEGSEAERYIDASVQCRGLCVTPLSRLGFIGSTDAKEIGATVYDFMDEGEVWFAEVERGGLRYLFFCDENGIITGDNACWILPN